MSGREPLAVRVSLPIFLIFKLNEGAAQIAFYYDAFASIIENGTDMLARLMKH